jgi:RNA polymerase sigma-70 factor (ECF subfamily)
VDAVLSVDVDLIARAREGDQNAFEALLQPLVLPAYRLAIAMLRNGSDAEDCVQEAALKAWRARRQLREGSTSIRPWFLAIVANESRSMRRGRWVAVIKRPAMDDEPTESARQEWDLAGLMDLRRALRSLAPSDRAILLLRYGLDLEIVEAATVMRLKPATAKSRIHRALAKLRVHLRLEEV